jgi:drug/metabolite transporter (DMT)-like permease
MFAQCADPKALEGLSWLMCYLTSGKHLLFYASFGTVLLLLAVTAPLALLFGFGGAMVIVQPGAETLQPAALLALGTALCYALVMIGARWIDRDDSVRTVMFYLTALPVLLTSWTLLLDWPAITAVDLSLFAAMAICGTIGITFITQGFRMAPAAIVAPFDYTALVWASITGWLFFGELPQIATYIGAAIIVAAGLFVIWREAQLAKR